MKAINIRYLLIGLLLTIQGLPVTQSAPITVTSSVAETSSCFNSAIASPGDKTVVAQKPCADFVTALDAPQSNPANPVPTSIWADYVFAPDFKLPTLEQVEAHIVEKKHLPGMPSEAEVKEKGIELVDMSIKQMAQIEQLMLHVIALNKQVKAQQAEIDSLKQRLDAKAGAVKEPAAQ